MAAQKKLVLVNSECVDDKELLEEVMVNRKNVTFRIDTSVTRDFKELTKKKASIILERLMKRFLGNNGLEKYAKYALHVEEKEKK